MWLIIKPVKKYNLDMRFRIIAIKIDQKSIKIVQQKYSKPRTNSTIEMI